VLDGVYRFLPQIVQTLHLVRLQIRSNCRLPRRVAPPAGCTGSSYGFAMSQELVAYFFEREDAEEVARRLAADDLTVRREKFHGEDDDEDHPWTVVLPRDIDRALAEELVTRYDGWLAGHDFGLAEADVAPLPNVAPLPDAPRRFKNPPKSV
jgi:hypothetical protein